MEKSDSKLEHEAKRPLNFIEQKIEADLAQGKHEGRVLIPAGTKRLPPYRSRKSHLREFRIGIEVWRQDQSSLR
jgi:hypothetical protein